MALVDLEKRLADALRRYLAATDDLRYGSGREVSDILAFLTGALLQDEERWSRYWYVDGLLEDSIDTVSARAIDVRGKLIWGGERNQWVEPFWGQISLASERAEAPDYQLHVGDAAVGLGKVAFGTHQRREGPPVTDWIFTIRNER
jgi:hypothetical protein